MVEIKRKEEEGEVFLPLKTKNSNFPYQNYEAFKYRCYIFPPYLKSQRFLDANFSKSKI